MSKFWNWNEIKTNIEFLKILLLMNAVLQTNGDINVRNGDTVFKFFHSRMENKLK